MEATTIISFDPHQLWALGVLDAINIGQLVHGQNLNHVLSTLKVLQLQDLKDFDVQLKVALVIICGHTCGSSVISIMSSATILTGLTNGSQCQTWLLQL
jgi:hypothetical protein